MMSAVNPKLHTATNAAGQGAGSQPVGKTPAAGSDLSPEAQVAHLTQLVKVKSQMVDDMLLERKQLVESEGTLEQKLKEADEGWAELKKQLKEAEQSALQEQDEWKIVCEKQADKIKALEEENERLKSRRGERMVETV
mmetsp:Transcript_50105/g.120030  ORF Transcript_50105/g.120030 Transcript_50105/m.120030 type:complete len:138 (+) Transcript_50105:107-520(+)